MAGNLVLPAINIYLVSVFAVTLTVTLRGKGQSDLKPFA